LNQQIIHVHRVQCCSNVLFAETRDVNKSIMLVTQISIHIQYWGKGWGGGKNVFKLLHSWVRRNCWKC